MCSQPILLLYWDPVTQMIGIQVLLQEFLRLLSYTLFPNWPSFLISILLPGSSNAFIIFPMF